MSRKNDSTQMKGIMQHDDNQSERFQHRPPEPGVDGTRSEGVQHRRPEPGVDSTRSEGVQLRRPEPGVDGTRSEGVQHRRPEPGVDGTWSEGVQHRHPEPGVDGTWSEGFQHRHPEPQVGDLLGLGFTDQAMAGPSSSGENMESGTLRCLSHLKRISDCHVPLKPLTFSRTHTVFIDIHAFNSTKQLKAQPGKHTWKGNFVKMPCSPESVVTVKKGVFQLGNSGPSGRWEVIYKQLTALAKKNTASVNDVEKAIKKYNPKYESQWSFDALESFVKSTHTTENYYTELFPKIANLASRLPHFVKKAIPLLQKGQSLSITLSQGQIACLLANAFFCTFPHRNTSHPQAEYRDYPTINFNSLFGTWSERKREKLRALLHYFQVVTNGVADRTLSGLVTFERRHVSVLPMWRSSKQKLGNLHISSIGSIEEDGRGMLQVDFACNLIGGGVLGSGLVQEEILFLMNPELIVSRLFTEKLSDNECLIITGSQQFSSYSGYSDSFEWAGPFDDTSERDEWRRLHRQILAIDALNFRQPSEQYTMRAITRELNKAYCGFKRNENSSPDSVPDIATGKWGCGAFNGDPQLKALIQLMAAAETERGLAFFTFKDTLMERDLKDMYHLLVTQGTTVGMLYTILEDYCQVRRLQSIPVDVFVKNTVGGQRSHL